jgi:hypothetical protein
MNQLGAGYWKNRIHQVYDSQLNTPSLVLLAVERALPNRVTAGRRPVVVPG